MGEATEMNRRSFLTILGAAAPALFLPKLIKPAWKSIPKCGYVEEVYSVNPEWIRAKYAYYTIQGELRCDDRILIGCRRICNDMTDEPPRIDTRTGIPYPIRGNEVVGGRIVPIPPWIVISHIEG